VKELVDYKRKGFVRDSIDAIVLMGIGLAVVTIIYIFGANMAGKIYGQFEDDIAAITDANVRASVEATSESGFQALEDTAEFTPTVALVVMVALVLAIFVGVLYKQSVGGGMGGGGAL
jgi:hypothetical protein